MVVSNTMMGATAQSTSKKQQHCGCEKNFCSVCRLPTCRPHRETQWAEGTLNSVYRKDFDEKAGLNERVRKPNELVPSLAKFDGRTTQRADFVPKKAATWSCRPAAKPVPAAAFNSQTTYGHYHKGKPGVPLEQRPAPPLAQSAPFQGLSTKQADFVDHGHQARPYEPAAWNIPQLAFTGSSTYGDDFTRKAIPERPERPPPPLLPSANAANSSTYGTDFVKHPIQACVAECCDHPHHPTHHIHLHAPAVGTLPGGAAAKLLGNTTGRTYRV